MPEERYEEYRHTTDFINEYIFPGGHLPSITALCNAMAKNSRLVVEDIANIGVHYAPTLAEWRRRFMENIPRVRALGFDEVFIRKWLYYFCYCEAGFATRTLGVHQIVYSRTNNTSTLGGVPIVGA